MDPELRKTCERVAQVRQRAAQLETEAAVRRGDKLQVELDVSVGMDSQFKFKPRGGWVPVTEWGKDWGPSEA